MGKPNNPQAFPHGNPTHGGEIGMTLRDWFAGQALAGLMSNTDHVVQARFEPFEDDLSLIETAARYSYHVADAMLEEREQTNGN